MKKHLNAFFAATLTLALCAAMTGCGDSKSKNPEDINEKEAEQALSSFEAEYGNTSNSQSDTDSSEDEPKKIVYAPTQEILDADFGSGLIQIGNDVFQQGGYITVAELVEQYSDRYDITYKDGTYEERKEYLLEYESKPCGNSTINLDHEYEAYQLYLTPKNENETHIITAYVVNMTSPDEKLTLDKASVFAYDVKGKLLNHGTGAYSEINTPVWSPKGFLVKGQDKYGWRSDDAQQISEKEYEINAFTSFVEGQGFALVEGNSIMMNDDFASYNNKYIRTNSNAIKIYIAGQANSAGTQPIFEYSFTFNADTDKLTSAISVNIVHTINSK